MNFTRKRLVRVPEERNFINNIDFRQEYANSITFVANERLVFLDETGYNLHITRNYGYSPKNVKAFKIVKGNRGKNVSCMVAIKTSGITAFEINDVRITQIILKTFWKQNFWAFFRNQG
jgi:hypothetical protein